MFIYDTDNYGYDIKRLQQLPTFIGLTEREIRCIIAKIDAIEQKEWEEKEKARRQQERVNDMAYIEESKDPNLPDGQVQIQQGVVIYPSIIDDKGFIPTEKFRSEKPVLKLFLDDKKKIYI